MAKHAELQKSTRESSHGLESHLVMAQKVLFLYWPIHLTIQFFIRYLAIYRVSHQYGNTFNFNFLILYQCYWKSKTCFEKFRSKPSKGHLDFDCISKIRLFFRVGKNQNKTEIFFGAMPPPFFQNVPRFCFLSFMYPGTWNFVSSSNPCTRVHGI